MIADHLLEGIPVLSVSGDSTVEVRQIEYDSRMVGPGALFVALRGGYADGHDYLPQARAAGAVACVVEPGTPSDLTAGFRLAVEVGNTRAALAQLAANFYSHPSSAMTVVGVTGTDGKTTTSHLIDAICRHNGQVTGLVGTVEVRIGNDSDLHESRQTTPESLLVQRYLAAMRERGVETATIEATSHGLELHRLDGCDFDIGVVTNVTHEHLDFHGTVERYRAAKGGLLRRVREAKERGKLGVAVINADDPGSRSLESYADGCRTMWHSVSDSNVDVQASEIVTEPGASTFTLHVPSGVAEARLNLPGRYNVANALSAACAAYALGLNAEQIAEGIASLAGVPGRMQTIDEGQPFTVIIDYAHTPEAIRSVLNEARAFTRGRLMALVGSAGERDREKRPIQGAVAVTNTDFAIFTSEDPRFEDPDAIIASIADGAREAGGREGVDFERIEDRRQAIAALLERAAEGDVVVLAGKGHEGSMIYGADKRPWNEAQVAREVLRELGYEKAKNRQITNQWSGR